MSTDKQAEKNATRQEQGMHQPAPDNRAISQQVVGPQLTPEQAKLAASLIRGDDVFQGAGQSGAHDSVLTALDAVAGGKTTK